MGSMWKVGDRVKCIPRNAHLFEGTPWKEKLSLPRCGTVEEVPLYARSEGHGTLMVRWDSLTDHCNAGPQWLQWVHSSLIARA